MVSNFTTEQLTKLIYQKLEPLEYNIILTNPTTETEFPVIVINTPLESTSKQYNNEIIQRKFQVSVECWENQKYAMQIMEEISQILLEYNFIRISTTPDTFDEKTKKYKMITTFEVKYNGLTNSFM